MTETFEIPLRLRYRDGPYKAALRIPYLAVTGPQSPVPDIGVVGSPTSGRSTVRGIGDLRLSGAVRIVGGGDDDWFHLELGAGVKLPTGNYDMGLGSGQIGLSALAEATFDIRPDLSLDLTFGRFFRTRRPDGLDLRDFFYVSADLGYDVLPRVTIGITLDAQQKSVSYGSAVLEAGLYAEYEFTSGTRIGLSVYRGFTRDSSDFAIGLLFSHRFSI
ncbi:MAG: transporter [Acetobacteraceae bacterium]